MWHDTAGRPVPRRIFSPLSDGPFRVDITSSRLPSLGVERMTFSAGVKARLTPEVLPDGIDDILLLVHEAGRRMVSQVGREATIGPGQGILVSNTDTDTHVAPEPSSFAVIVLPRKPMMALAPGLEDAFVRPLPPDTDVLRLLMRYLAILKDERELSTPQLQRTVAAHIHDLCALAIGATRDAAEIAEGRGLRAARLRTIKADIVGNLEDEDLSVAAVARRHRITPRYLHKLFESEGTTFSQFVLGQRLARVHRLLADPRHAHRTIGSLAYHVGFGDLSSFNHAFRRHFGTTPSDVRACARRG